MSVLVIQLPPRDRLRARSAADTAAAWRLPQEWSFVLSSDGRTVAQAGQAPLALMPRADSVVLLLAEADVGWHRVPIPRAPAARVRAALAGVMEESLLDDDEALHLALGPGAAAGREGWVAVTHRPWLQAALAALEGAGRTVERVLPAGVPTAAAADPARGHFFVADAGDEAVPWLTLARADGVVCLRLAGGLARSLLPAADEAVHWTATPAAAAAAEQWLGAPVPLMSDAERALEAARGATNLRQFELAPRHRGSRVVRAGARRFLSAEWRPVRVGLGVLAALHLLGLNAYAWQQRAALADKRQAMSELLRATHPGVRTVLDAPLQMQRETERLRAAAGRAGDNDLEVLLAVAASAWPDGQGPVQALRFETGQLTLTAPAWAEAQQAQFRERLRGAGFAAEFSEGRLTVTRAAG